MDTGTHFIMGIGIAGLAQLDPVVSSTSMSEAILLATIIGSQAPDFDAIYRLKGNAVYISKHRGASHSLPALLLYSILISLGIACLFAKINLTHLFFWTLAALAIHVLTDLMNEYGTQAFRPFSQRWISWNILHIFDPVIFATHIIGILLWLSGFPPGPVFGTIYVILLFYGLWRYWLYKATLRKVELITGFRGKIDLFPTIYPFQWNVLWYGDQDVKFGRYRKGGIEWWESFPHLPHHPVVDKAKEHPDIQNFLYFSRYAHLDYSETDFGYEVRWIDLRYRHKKNYPLIAILYLNKKMNPIGSYVGYMPEEKAERKLKFSIETNG